jgi:tetratricopeptide (TPR) repeat protein
LALVLLAGTAPVAGQTGEVRPDTQRQILQKLQTAHVLYSQRDYAAARTLYLEVLPHYPQDFVILKNLAFSNYRLRRYEEAAQYFRQAYELNPTREVRAPFPPAGRIPRRPGSCLAARRRSLRRGRADG